MSEFICPKCGEVDPEVIYSSCPAQADCPKCGMCIESIHGIRMLSEEEGRAKRPGLYAQWDKKKEDIWNYMFSLPKNERPFGCTDKRMTAIHDTIIKDKDFWYDIIHRHGLTEMDKTLEQLKIEDIETYNHCIGNFWGMLMEKI